MKTKAVTKQRKQLRDMDLINFELSGEFGSVLDESFIDEEAFVMCEDED